MGQFVMGILAVLGLSHLVGRGLDFHQIPPRGVCLMKSYKKSTRKGNPSLRAAMSWSDSTVALTEAAFRSSQVLNNGRDSVAEPVLF